MLECEGYKMFRGAATVVPKCASVEPFILVGTWLYKPDTDCWYCGGRSFSADIVTDITLE